MHGIRAWMKTANITINGDPWKFRILRGDRFLHMHPEADLETQAITDSDEMIVDILDSQLSEEVIRHELIHVFVSQCCLDSASLSADQMEEVIADIYARNHSKLEVYTSIILNLLGPKAKSGSPVSKSRK